MRPEIGTTLGPVGVPMTDAQAFALEQLLPSIADPEPKRLTIPAGLTTLAAEERADVSWISTEAKDRYKDVVLASGLDESHYRMNPVVTLNHNYDIHPVGKSVWRKKVMDGDERGILAKTHYPSRPSGWVGDWAPDQALSLIQAGLMSGKSVSFLTVESRPPTEADLKARPEWAGARRIVSKWLLLEYCCCWLPVQQEAVVAAVSKSFAGLLAGVAQVAAEPTIGRFLTLAEAKKAADEALERIDVTKITADAVARRRGNP